MDVVQVISALTALVSVLASVLYARRAKKAEIRAKEIENRKNDIGNAELMIELVKKANAEASEVQHNLIETLKKENGKFKKSVERLERAFRSIHRCPYRDNCPVYAELQGEEGNEQQDLCTDGNDTGNRK
jgi:Flp pilus assembly protein TadB